jgi:hypothetical protein
MRPATDVSLADTADGRRIEVSRRVDTPVERAWEVLTDTERWPSWGPTVTEARADRRFVRAGTRGEVQVLSGPWLPFEVTACADYRWTWDVARVPATGHRVEAEPHERSRVVFELPALAAGSVPVCARALSNVARLVGGDRAADEEADTERA